MVIFNISEMFLLSKLTVAVVCNTPDLTPVFSSKKGDLLGLFLITVTSCSVTKISAAKSISLFSTISLVLLFSFATSVPAIDLAMFIFLGSVLLSVQNNISSTMFKPVINLSLSNLKTLFLNWPFPKEVVP